MNTPLPTPSFRFKAGKLYIFTPREIMIVRGWPDPEAVHKKADADAWRHFTPQFRLVRPYRPKARKKPKPDPQLSLLPDEAIAVRPKLTLPERRKAAFDSFRFSLPKDVARRLERFQSHQWYPLLILHAGGEQALDLFQTCPALAFCLANFPAFRNPRERDPATALPMLTRKQQEILGWLGFPASRSAVNALRKVAPESISVPTGKVLREAMRDPDAASLLAHVPSINAGVITMVGDAELRRSVTPSLLAEVAEDKRHKYYAHAADLLTDVREMLAVVRPNSVDQKFRSLASLRRTHEEIGEQYCRVAQTKVIRCRFPRPPVPGTPRIVPLTTPQQLIDEGSQQENCVASYAKRVEARRTYIYRVLAPERATLSLVRTASGWAVGELLLARNRTVAPRTRKAVESWLSQRQILGA